MISQLCGITTVVWQLNVVEVTGSSHDTFEIILISSPRFPFPASLSVVALIIVR